MATPNFGWVLPTVGGDPGTWGTKLNDVFDKVAAPVGIDQALNAVKTTADAALARAGGVMTGEVEQFTERYVTVDKGSISGTQGLDLATANFFFATISGATTFTFDNPAATGKFQTFIIELTNGGVGVTWPLSVDWPGGTVPTLALAGVDVLVFYTRDGGTTWRGALSQGDSK